MSRSATAAAVEKIVHKVCLSKPEDSYPSQKCDRYDLQIGKLIRNSNLHSEIPPIFCKFEGCWSFMRDTTFRILQACEETRRLEETLVFVFNIKVADQEYESGCGEKSLKKKWTRNTIWQLSYVFFSFNEKRTEKRLIQHTISADFRHWLLAKKQVDNATFDGGALKDLRGLHFAARLTEKLPAFSSSYGPLNPLLARFLPRTSPCWKAKGKDVVSFTRQR